MDNPKLTVLLDNGHGSNTPGKRSPDGALLEYRYCREITARIKRELDKYPDISCEILVPEEWDVTLHERCARANRRSRTVGRDNCVFVSVHNNAAGSGGWMSARGWQVHTHTNCSQKSTTLAVCLHDAAVALGCKTRKPMSTQKYWKNNFQVLRETECPAVLTENFFQDNREDVAWLLSEKGKETVTAIHVKGILDYYRKVFGKDAAQSTLPMGGCTLK